MNFGGFDLFLGNSPFEQHHLIARGLRADLSLDSQNYTISFLEKEAETSSLDTENLGEAIDNCRTAVVESVFNATQESNVVAECSGGIDSGLTAVLASRVVQTRFDGAIFADYPYYEFRQERTFARAIADREGFKVLNSDPSLWVRWGALKSHYQSSVYIEPSLHIPYWGQALAGYSYVSQKRCAAVLTGQGGDSLFHTRNLSPVFPPKPQWMPTTYWDMISEETGRVREWIESPSRVCCGYGFDNPWMSRALRKIHGGAIYYSPLSSRTSIKAFSNLKRLLDPVLTKKSNPFSNAQKPIAYAVFADYLPENVWVRRWKVNYVGLYYRSWFYIGKKFVDLAKRMSPFLESIGFVPRHIVDGVTEMADGRKSSDRL
jgi:hypothetical protein